MEEKSLEQLRQKVDSIDAKLIECLAERFQLASKIALHKRLMASPVLQPARASEVERRYVELGIRSGMDAEFMRLLFHLIHKESCRVQSEFAVE